MANKKAVVCALRSGDQKCCFCGLKDDDEVKYGKFYEYQGIVTHYFCLVSFPKKWLFWNSRYKKNIKIVVFSSFFRPIWSRKAKMMRVFLVSSQKTSIKNWEEEDDW